MSQTYQNKFGTNYRTEFFKHHKGLFGLYFCTYCGKIMHKSVVTVDHVVPKSKFLANKVWDANTKFNLVAACHSCNSSKGNKVDLRIVQGELVLLLGPVGIVAGQAIRLFSFVSKILTKVGLWAVGKVILKTVFKLIKNVPAPVQVIAIGALLYYLNSIGVLGELDIVANVKNILAEFMNIIKL